MFKLYYLSNLLLKNQQKREIIKLTTINKLLPWQRKKKVLQLLVYLQFGVLRFNFFALPLV